MNVHTILQNTHWILLTLGLNITQHTLCKKAADTIGWEQVFQGRGSWWDLFHNIFVNKYTFLLGICTMPAYATWFLVLSRIPMSIAVPLLSLNYIATAFIGYFFFAETLSALKILGIFLIIAGVSCLVHS